MIIFLYIIFLIIYKNEKIIDDTGLKQNIHFSIGTILYFLSYFFITYMNFTGCVLNFLLKHIGISTILFICYTNITMNYRLGFRKRDDSKFKFLKEELEKQQDENVYSCHMSNGYNNMKSAEIKNFQGKNSLFTLKDIETKSENSSWFNEANDNYYKKVKNTHSLYVKLFIFYLFIIMSIVITVIVYSFKFSNIDDLYQNRNYWIFKCSLDEPDLFYNSIYVLIIIIILITGRVASEFELIFNLMIYITYSAYISIITGPAINVNII